MDTTVKSRTQKKKEDQALQQIGEQLVALPPSLLEIMALPDELLADIEFARTIKSHGARRRQIRHIGAILRHMDSQPIQIALERIQSRNMRK